MLENDKSQLELELSPASKADEDPSIQAIQKSTQKPSNIISFKKVIAERTQNEDARIFSKISSLADHLY